MNRRTPRGAHRKRGPPLESLPGTGPFMIPGRPQPARLFLIPAGTIELSLVKNVTFFTIPL